MAPFADFPIQHCTDCGSQLKPLGITMFCPNDCDRKPLADLAGQVTEPITRKSCPFCKSFDVQPYLNFWVSAMHCVDCGKVF